MNCETFGQSWKDIPQDNTTSPEELMRLGNFNSRLKATILAKMIANTISSPLITFDR